MTRLIRLAAAPVLALALLTGAVPGFAPGTAEAAGCLRIIGGRFDAPGNDNFARYLNGEYIRIKNVCTTYRLMTGARVHDYGRKHTFYFPDGYKVRPNGVVTLHSGRGTNTYAHVYWQRTYGAVWNNTPPERASLRSARGILISSWSPY
jgi:hypothetical protein